MGEKQDRWDGKTLPFGEDCYDYCRRVFFNRWKPRIIHAIQFDNDCTRFSRFTRQLPISEKVLAQNLRELEEDGIITRTVYPETPIRVEYHLTPAGKSLCACWMPSMTGDGTRCGNAAWTLTRWARCGTATALWTRISWRRPRNGEGRHLPGGMPLTFMCVIYNQHRVC